MPRLGYHQTEEHRRKLSEALRGKPKSETHRVHNASARAGRSLNPAHREAVRQGLLRSYELGHRKPSFRSRLEQLVERNLREKKLDYAKQFYLTQLRHAFDFVLLDRRLLIEVDGCYWHGCSCTPNSLRWAAARDRRIDAAVASLGWSILRIRECHLQEDLARLSNAC